MAELRDECFNEHLFASLAEARRIIQAWRIDYNTKRPHTSLDGLTPTEFAARPTKGGITRTDSPSERGHSGVQVIRCRLQNYHRERQKIGHSSRTLSSQT
jgi:hypothetical protein